MVNQKMTTDTNICFKQDSMLSAINYPVSLGLKSFTSKGIVSVIETACQCFFGEGSTQMASLSVLVILCTFTRGNCLPL